MRVAHQPNFMVSGTVAVQLSIARRFRSQLSGACVLEVIDYGDCWDKRFRHAYLPSHFSSRGYVVIPGPAHNDCERLINKQQISGLGWLEDAIQKLDSVSIRHMRQAGDSWEAKTGRQRLRSIVQVLRNSYREGSSESDCTLQTWWALGIERPDLIKSGAAALPLLADHMTYLWTRTPEIVRQYTAALKMLHAAGASITDPRRHLGEVPFWFICDCGARRSMSFSGTSPASLVSNCRRCDRGSGPNIISENEFRRFATEGRIVPRILIDDLLDGMGWTYSIGCSYAGGISHYIVSAITAGLCRLPVLPEFFSRVESYTPVSTIGRSFLGQGNDRPSREAELLTSQGRATCGFYYMVDGPDWTNILQELTVGALRTGTSLNRNC